MQIMSATAYIVQNNILKDKSSLVMFSQTSTVETKCHVLLYQSQ